MKRRKLLVKDDDLPSQEGGLYFPGTYGVKCIPTGCTLLDCVLGGGWARGRIANLVGDKAVGKTLLAIEACANFAQQEPTGLIFYREAEAAFDESYAETLGLPVGRVDFGEEGVGTVWDTIEVIFEDLDKQLDRLEAEGVPGLYIIDSLDAVSSKAELERKPGEGSFALEKQKMLGLLFRKLVRRIKALDMTVIIVSQIRDKIGVVFGEKHTRSGGKSLDFYASQIVWLSHIATLTKTIGGAKRATGQRIKAKCKKNKVTLPFRDCEFVLRFQFGVEDVGASLDFLASIKKLESALGSRREAFEDALEEATGVELQQLQDKLRRAVVAAWTEVEGRFTPKRRKYSVETAH